MPKVSSNKNRYNFLIDRGVYAEFSKICEELGYVRSKNLENYMKQVIKNNKEVLERLKSGD